MVASTLSIHDKDRLVTDRNDRVRAEKLGYFFSQKSKDATAEAEICLGAGDEERANYWHQRAEFLDEMSKSSLLIVLVAHSKI